MRAKVPPSSGLDAAIRPGISEFGARFAAYLREVPEATGLVLTDALGDPIDQAHRADRIEELDVQIAGAQLVRVMAKACVSAQIHGLGVPTLVLESTFGALLARRVGSEYLLVAVFDAAFTRKDAVEAFERVASDSESLLD